MAERQLKELEDELELRELEKKYAIRDRLYLNIQDILNEIEPDLAAVHMRQLRQQHSKLTLDEENRKLIVLKRGFMKMRDDKREENRRRERTCLQNGWNKFCDFTYLPTRFKFKGKRSMRKPSNKKRKSKRKF